MKDKKDLNYWKANAEEDYLHTPISVLRYITELETAVKNCSIPDVSGSAEADYWSNRCKLVEDIWDNTPYGDHIEELAELQQDYHKFIKENGNRHYRQHPLTPKRDGKNRNSSKIIG